MPRLCPNSQRISMRANLLESDLDAHTWCFVEGAHDLCPADAEPCNRLIDRKNVVLRFRITSIPSTSARSRLLVSLSRWRVCKQVLHEQVSQRIDEFFVHGVEDQHITLFGLWHRRHVDLDDVPRLDRALMLRKTPLTPIESTVLAPSIALGVEIFSTSCVLVKPGIAEGYLSRVAAT